MKNSRTNQSDIRRGGFALPSVLISSVIMLMVLVTAVSLTISIRSSIDENRYDQLAGMAAEAGTAYALSCLKTNGDLVTWSDTKPLRPNTDCNGNVVGGRSAYVLEQPNVLRTYFIVKKPLTGSGNQPISASSRGYVELLRTSTGAAWKIFENSDVVALGGQNDGRPVGTSIDGYWTTAPQGYLLEDGSAVSRTTYANLFSVIGTTYGAGNGSTTFNLPDSRGRVAVAKSPVDSEFDTLGEKAGTKTVALTESQMPSHDHDFAGMSVYWGAGGGGNSFREHEGSTDYIVAAGGASPAGNTMYTYQNSDGWADTYNAGSGAAHNNLQYYIVVLRAIKY